MNRVILTDPESRKTFDIYNYLSDSYPLDLVLLCTEKPTLVLKTLYPKVTIIFQKQPDSLYDELFSFLEKNGDDMFVHLPMEESSIATFYNLLESDKNIPANLRFFLPDRNAFDLVRNKVSLSRFCSDIGVSVPREYGRNDLVGRANIKYPLIIKPALGSGSMGQYRVASETEIEAFARFFTDDHFIVQELLENSSKVEGAFFLAKDGIVEAFYSHNRLRTFPVNGGVTVFSESTNNQNLYAIGNKIVKHLRWSGLLMIEFLWDESETEYKLIEINPRPWGSILLSEFCGANLVIKYVCSALDYELVPRTKTMNDFSHKYIRWLFPYDFILFLKGNVPFKQFMNFSKKDTCYISMTYCSWSRSLLWHLRSVFSQNNIKKLLSKVRS